MTPNKKQDQLKNKEWLEAEGELAIDVYLTEKEVVIQSAIAGVKSEDLDVSAEDDIVVIKGERECPAPDKDKQYLFQECYWGKFSRKIIIPEEIDPSRIEAAVKDGVLTIRIPRIIRTKSKVEIK